MQLLLACTGPCRTGVTISWCSCVTACAVCDIFEFWSSQHAAFYMLPARSHLSAAAGYPAGLPGMAAERMMPHDQVSGTDSCCASAVRLERRLFSSRWMTARLSWHVAHAIRGKCNVCCKLSVPTSAGHCAVLSAAVLLMPTCNAEQLPAKLTMNPACSCMRGTQQHAMVQTAVAGSATVLSCNPPYVAVACSRTRTCLLRLRAVACLLRTQGVAATDTTDHFNCCQASGAAQNYCV